MQDVMRVMWLSNDPVRRVSDIALLKSVGAHQFFVPKSFPFEISTLGWNVDETFDESLDLPEKELTILNSQNWYEKPTLEAWSTANRFFDTTVIGAIPTQIDSVCRNFQGTIILRATGLPEGQSYTEYLYETLGPPIVDQIRSLGSRFVLGCDHEYMIDREGHVLKSLGCHLPSTVASDIWEGKNNQLYFVCPQIQTSESGKATYEAFTQEFEDFDYRIGGLQPVPVDDDSQVLNESHRTDYLQHLREFRVLFYHSQDENVIHEHALEAIHTGIPTVFMAGGFLDEIGGERLAGRCRSLGEAKAKISRILNRDQGLVARIRKSQQRLQEQLSADNCSKQWKRVFSQLQQASGKVSPSVSTLAVNRTIGLLLPDLNLGSLKQVTQLAEVIHEGSVAAGEPCRVFLAHPKDESIYKTDAFKNLPDEIQTRPFTWTIMEQEQAEAAMNFSGHPEWTARASAYVVPEDGTELWNSCDFWIVASDRLTASLFPTRPYICLVKDYRQRYVGQAPLPHADQPYLELARNARAVWCTTDFTCLNAQQYAGLRPEHVYRVPLLVRVNTESVVQEASSYFLWPTTLRSDKNHENAFEALYQYYTQHDGQLSCRVTGSHTEHFFSKDHPQVPPHIKDLAKFVKRHKVLKKRLRFLGELPEPQFQRELSEASFLWHTSFYDNGSPVAVEAACHGVPTLSSDYPPMREIDERFHLNLNWMDADDPREMAQKLKDMEAKCLSLREQVRDQASFEQHSMSELARTYWALLREQI